ncbi:MAG: hypothetical protein WDN75_02865 [Bacteroidota bacterium]
MRKIPEMIKQIIEGMENTRFDRAHFASFSEYALVFEVVYFVDSPDYTKYMDTQQLINLKIVETFKKENIKIPCERG